MVLLDMDQIESFEDFLARVKNLEHKSLSLEGELTPEVRRQQEQAINQLFRKRFNLPDVTVSAVTVEIAKRRYRPRAERLHRAQIECQGRHRNN